MQCVALLLCSGHVAKSASTHFHLVIDPEAIGLISEITKPGSRNKHHHYDKLFDLKSLEQ